MPSQDVERVTEEGVVAVAALEAEAYQRLFPLQHVEGYLNNSVRLDGRPLGRARPTNIVLGQVPHTDGSALIQLGNTRMLAGIKLEVCVPSIETPDAGSIAVDFQMPPVCSPLVRPGRPAPTSYVINEQLSNILGSSALVDLRELSITSGKAAWLAYLDIYCLNADGSLLDAALLACVAAFANLQIPAVSINDDGKVQRLSSVNYEQSANSDMNGLNQQSLQEEAQKPKRRLKLGPVPGALTCMMYKKHLLMDPTAEEEDVLHTTFTVVVDGTGRLISMFKPGGLISASTSAVQDCIELARLRLKEVQKLLADALETANASQGPEEHV